MSTVDDFKLESSFESVRSTLLQDRFADRLTRPLGYWVLPNDRRLPLAFLDRTLKELLSTPFGELSATPGIGQKKISSLVKLLERATKDQPPAVPFGAGEISENGENLSDKQIPQNTFDPTVVSEALWSEWCDIVRRFNVGNEKLGRLAPSLNRLPTVIWHTRLAEYLDQSVGEIRNLRTHGEKRVRCVLEVFHSVYTALANASPEDDLKAKLTPPLIAKAQAWVHSQVRNESAPDSQSLREEFAIPILEQIKIDSGETVYSLAVERLGINGPPQSVREQSRNLGVTRARIYQLLDDCSKVMEIRWPEGKNFLDSLTTRFADVGPDGQNLSLFYGLRELCYPEKARAQSPSDLMPPNRIISPPHESVQAPSFTVEKKSPEVSYRGTASDEPN